MTWVQPNMSHLEFFFNFRDDGNVFSSFRSLWRYTRKS